jgi:hypothetical protein
MKTHWPHSTLSESSERRDADAPTEHHLRTRYLPAERDQTLPAQGETTITLSLKLLRR